MTGGPEVLRPLESEADVEGALALPRVLIYKHSPRCGASGRAREEVVAFAREHPDLPVYEVDVVDRRPLSQGLAERLDVWHQSPQAILVEGGEAVWDDSHGGVTAQKLEQALLARPL